MENWLTFPLGTTLQEIVETVKEKFPGVTFSRIKMYATTDEGVAVSLED